MPIGTIFYDKISLERHRTPSATCPASALSSRPPVSGEDSSPAKDATRSRNSANATVKHFREEKLLFPQRPRSGPDMGELRWKPLRASRVLKVLHNPRYAGAYVYGRSRTRRRPGGGVVHRPLAREEWTVLLRNAHPGYITWDRFEENERRLRDNARTYGVVGRRGPPREGAARPLRLPSNNTVPRAPARGGSTAAGPGHLRRVRQAHDSALPAP